MGGIRKPIKIIGQTIQRLTSDIVNYNFTRIDPSASTYYAITCNLSRPAIVTDCEGSDDRSLTPSSPVQARVDGGDDKV